MAKAQHFVLLLQQRTPGGGNVTDPGGVNHNGRVGRGGEQKKCRKRSVTTGNINDTVKGIAALTTGMSKDRSHGIHKGKGFLEFLDGRRFDCVK